MESIPHPLLCQARLPPRPVALVQNQNESNRGRAKNVFPVQRGCFNFPHYPILVQLETPSDDLAAPHPPPSSPYLF